MKKDWSKLRLYLLERNIFRNSEFGIRNSELCQVTERFAKSTPLPLIDGEGSTAKLLPHNIFCGIMTANRIVLVDEEFRIPHSEFRIHTGVLV